VESAKSAARELLDSPIATSAVDFVDNGIAVKGYGIDLVGATVSAALDQLLSLASDASYISIHAYLNRMEYPQLAELRDVLAKKTGRPVTFGWGPRFLHSTGQYHKGGPKQGIFIQLLGEFGMDLAIEGRPFSFGTLINAQAAGDAQVLANNGLPVVSLKFDEPLAGLELMKRVLAQ